jgi:hypothetical protein
MTYPYLGEAYREHRNDDLLRLEGYGPKLKVNQRGAAVVARIFGMIEGLRIGADVAYDRRLADAMEAGIKDLLNYLSNYGDNDVYVVLSGDSDGVSFGIAWYRGDEAQLWMVGGAVVHGWPNPQVEKGSRFEGTADSVRWSVHT